MELSTLVIYDIEDDRARTRVSEACKDFGLERMQFSCFRGTLSQNKREELYEKLRRIQREWETRWHKDFPEAQTKQMDLPVPPGEEAKGRWQPAFKIMIQPMCEKDVKTALYAYLFADIPKDLESERKKNADQTGDRD
jgi:hypothetical protein